MTIEHDSRRAAARVPIELKVEYEKKNSFFSDYTKNISQGGIFIVTNEPMPIGTHFVFNLHVTDLKEPLNIKGTVRFVAKPGGQREPGMGIEFDYADDKEKTYVHSVVKQLMEDSLGKTLSDKLWEKAEKASKITE